MPKPFKGSISKWGLFYGTLHGRYVIVGEEPNTERFICTSFVLRIDFESGVVETTDSLYLLDGPSNLAEATEAAYRRDYTLV